MKRANIALTPFQILTVKNYAIEEGVSTNEAFRRVINAGLEKLRIKKTAAEALLEWGRKNTFAGPADLASNIDYLYKQ